MQTLSNITSFVSLGMAFSIVFFFKQVLDTNRVINSNPWIKKKPFRVLSGIAVCCLFVVAFKPEYTYFASVLFIVLVAVILLYSSYHVRSNKIDIKQVSIGDSTYLLIPKQKYKGLAEPLFDPASQSLEDQNHVFLKIK